MGIWLDSSYAGNYSMGISWNIVGYWWVWYVWKVDCDTWGQPSTKSENMVINAGLVSRLAINEIGSECGCLGRIYFQAWFFGHVWNLDGTWGIPQACNSNSYRHPMLLKKSHFGMVAMGMVYGCLKHWVCHMILCINCQNMSKWNTYILG